MVKVKFILEQALKVQRGLEIWLYSFFNLGARWEWVVTATPRPLYPRDRDPVSIAQEAVWAPGPVWTSAENLAFTGTQTVHPIAIPSTLIRLSEGDSWQICFVSSLAHFMLLKSTKHICTQGNISTVTVTKEMLEIVPRLMILSTIIVISRLHFSSNTKCKGE